MVADAQNGNGPQDESINNLMVVGQRTDLNQDQDATDVENAADITANENLGPERPATNIGGETKGAHKDLEYIFEDLKMPKPFKRDKNRKRLFDKNKLIKQIRQEQKERYQQQAKFVEEVQNNNIDSDSSGFGSEDDEFERQDPKGSFFEFMDPAKTKCQRIILGIKQFLSLKYGVEFFSYDNKNNNFLKSDIGKVPKDASFFDRAKLIISLLVAISLLFGILIDYITILGTEKSQSLLYSQHSNLTYDISRVPVLIPFHQFLFFEEDQVKERMLCKLYNDEGECMDIEKAKCETKDQTSEDYELCMIDLHNKILSNATRFCVNHYAELSKWQDNLHPKYILYHQRKFNCFNTTGVPYGREYCETMMEFTPGSTKEGLFNCFRKHNVDFGLDYCLWKFDVDQAVERMLGQAEEMATTDLGEGESREEVAKIAREEAKPKALEQAKNQMVSCFGSKGVPKGPEYCEVMYKEDLSAKINCYDELKIKSL